MPEESKIKIVGVKNTRIRSLKIKGLRPKPLIIRNLTLKDVRKAKG
jgi:hypothetical protein